MSQQMRLDRPGLYSFHRPLATPVDNKQLQRVNLPISILAALGRINRHKFSLSALGILPNDLRKLSRAEGYDPEPLLDTLRRAFFWGSYKIWKKRKRLVKLLWESKKSTQQQQRLKGKNCSNCKSPFHFHKKIADFSKQRLTKCPCSRIEKSKSSLPDIRSHFSAKPNKSIVLPNRVSDEKSVNVDRSNSLDYKHVPTSKNHNSCTRTRADIIRSEHDRGKKRKMVQLNLFQVLYFKRNKKEFAL